MSLNDKLQKERDAVSWMLDEVGEIIAGRSDKDRTKIFYESLKKHFSINRILTGPQTQALKEVYVRLTD